MLDVSERNNICDNWITFSIQTVARKLPAQKCLKITETLHGWEEGKVFSCLKSIYSKYWKQNP
jgi:hypothetical protein